MPRVVPKKRPEPRNVMLGAFIPAEQRRRLVERAQVEDRSLSSIVRLALNDYLARPPTSGGTLDDVRAEAALLQQQAMSRGSS